jgi:hypothetical protein
MFFSKKKHHHWCVRANMGKTLFVRVRALSAETLCEGGFVSDTLVLLRKHPSRLTVCSGGKL